MSEYKQQFIELFDKNHSGIYRFLRLRVATDDIAQDITSEAFARAWRFIVQNPQKFPQNPRAYLYKTARNCLADYYRRDRGNELYFDDSVLKIIDKNGENAIMGADQGVFDSVQMGRIQKALKELEPNESELITLRFIEDLSYPEIAEIIGKNEGAARTALSRAVERLRKMLTE